MMREPTGLPGYWLFFWMFWMQPISLHYWLVREGVGRLNIPGWRLIKNWKTLQKGYKDYFWRLCFTLILGVSLLLTPCVIADFGLGILVEWRVFALAVGGLVAFVAFFSLILSVGFGVGFGVSFGVPFGVAFCLAFGMLADLTSYLDINPVANLDAFRSYIGLVYILSCFLAFFLSLGVAVGVTRSFLVGDAGSTRQNVALFVVIFVAIGIAISMVSDLQIGVIVGIISVGLFMVTYLRLPIYVPEAILQFFLSIPYNRQVSLRYSPILSHDLIYSSLPLLSFHIVNAANANPTLAWQVIEAAQRSPGQKEAAADALACLQAQEFERYLRNNNFTALCDLHGEWLPGKDTSDTTLQALAQCANFMRAAVNASTPHIAKQHLREVINRVGAIINGIRTTSSHLRPYLPPILELWIVVCKQQIAKFEAQAVHPLPNPFVVQTPLTLDFANGKDLFRGREHVIAELESCLVDTNQRSSLLILGPRRCGKSSVLNMLRLQLPDALVFLFDLQGLSSSTPQGFYRALSETAQRQARDVYQLNLPGIAHAADIDDLRTWLQALEEFPAKPRILLCIDEFERLESLFPGDEKALLQLMGLLRSTIQHQRRVRLLLAGAAPFDELGRIWHDHLLNLREMRLGYLDAPTAQGLLQHPFQGFPPDVFDNAVTDAIFARCHGHPFLTQAYGFTLLEHLNQAQRKQAMVADVDAVEREILMRFPGYFNDLWCSMPPEAQQFVEAQANGQALPDIASAHKRWLRRRLLIDKQDQPQVALFLRWVREHEEMD